MGYEKPVCECGVELQICDQVVYQEWNLISKSGKPQKRILDRARLGSFNPSFGGWGAWLTCPKCHANYSLEYDSKNRIIKADREDIIQYDKSE